MATTNHERALSVILFCQEDTEIQTQALRSLTEQTLSTEQFEILVPTTLAQSHDLTGPFDTRTYTTVNEAIGLATGRIVLFVDSAYTLATTLLDTHLAMHRNRPEGKLCVMGGATPDTARHCNPLARYIDEDSLLNPYRGLLPLGLVEAKDVQLHNLSIPQQAFIKHGRFDTHFANHDIAIVDFCFRVHDAGYKILYAMDAQTHYTQTPDLARIERTQHRLAKDWVSVFMKHPNRLREWGGLRHATRLQLETQAEETRRTRVGTTEHYRATGRISLRYGPDESSG